MKKIKYMLLAITIATAIILSTLSASAAATQTDPLSTTSAGIQDSVVLGSWNNSYLKYNCYAYALGLTNRFYIPGYFAYGKTEFDMTDTIQEIALNVKADLKSTGTNGLNHKCVKMTTVYPTSIPTGYSCICVRKGTKYANPAETDFHFMRYSGSNWYHKPGRTQPLKYNYTPSASRSWSNEAMLNGVYYEPTIEYTGTIYYFIYGTQHADTVYGLTGNNYHSGNVHYYEYGYKCSNCYEVIGETMWEYLPCNGNTCIEPWNLRDEPLAA